MIGAFRGTCCNAYCRCPGIPQTDIARDSGTGIDSKGILTTNVYDCIRIPECGWSKILSNGQSIVTGAWVQIPSNSTIITDIIAVGVNIVTGSKVDKAGDRTGVEELVHSGTKEHISSYGAGIIESIDLIGTFEGI